ncbi:MAG: hypothetical protein PHE79_11330 [Eubacteriales bacterium]|nr:hypothetical protein [Eubacteriales bacterium]
MIKVDEEKTMPMINEIIEIAGEVEVSCVDGEYLVIQSLKILKTV